jgi:hypothetical protein
LAVGEVQDSYIVISEAWPFFALLAALLFVGVLVVLRRRP